LDLMVIDWHGARIRATISGHSFQVKTNGKD
jgi:hypothetical protein